MLTVENRVIAITRPENQAGAWKSALESAGFGVFLCPLLEILPLSDSAQSAVRQALREFLSEKSAIIFVSPNAVRFALQIESAQFWAAHFLLAVGAGTQKILKENNLNAAIPSDSEDSEGLLKLIESQRDFPPKIAIIRGDHGREFLGDSLKEKGFCVQKFGVYTRKTCDAKTAQGLANKALAGDIDGVLITSSEALQAWIAQLKSPRLPAALVKLPLFSIHPRISESAQRLGFENVVNLKNSKALVDFFGGDSNGEKKPQG